MGNTGAGKSTLINYLSGKELVVGQFNKIALKDPNDLSALEIGLSTTSATLLPRVIELGNFSLCDLGGFEDTRGVEANLLSALFIKRILESSNSTKLVFVVGKDEMEASRGKDFKELLKKVERLIPEKKIFDFSALVITKSDLDSELVSYLKEMGFDDYVNSWKGFITQMSKPVNKVIDQSQRDGILKIIKEIRAEKIDSVDIGVVYPYELKFALRDLYRKEMEEKINVLTDKKRFSSNDVRVLAGQIDYFNSENFIKDVYSEIDNSVVIQFFSPLSKGIYEQSLKSFDEYVTEKRQQIVKEVTLLKGKIEAENKPATVVYVETGGGGGGRPWYQKVFGRW